MTEIRFYHLQNQSMEQALPALLTKAFENGHKIVIRAATGQQVQALNDHLWTWHPNSFLPHGTKAEGNPEHQPIWLTDCDENPGGATTLILLDGQSAENLETYDLVCEIFNGRDDQAVKNARERWKIHKENGFDLTYWQQNERGGWDKKA